MTASNFQPIANALIRKIFVVATLCALFFGAVQAGLAYRAERQHFNDVLSDIGLTNVPMLSVLVWDIEPQAVQRQIQYIAERPQVGFVRLRVTTGRVYEAGKAPEDPSLVLDHFDIPAPPGMTGSLGTLEIGSNLGNLYSEVMASAGLAVAGYGALTLLICAVIAMILRRDLQQPLTHIARFVGQLDPHRLSDPITLHRPDHHQQQHDEIDIVLEGFRTLQNGIDQHIANLDRLVAERTVKLEQAMAEIHVLSITDPLTHCFNRRLFNERIAQEFERAKRYDRPLSLIFCDIDHFKHINDTFGHTTGDDILSQVAGCYRDGLRADIDWVARYGGEEFVIVLPETELESARATAERRRAAIAARAFTNAEQTLCVTSSFGVAQLQADESVEVFLNRADRAVYRAKAQGRDCVVCDLGTSDDV